MGGRDEARRAVLEALGARGEIPTELLAYNSPGCQPGSVPPGNLPMADEPHVEAWRAYAREASDVGVFAALQHRLVQLRFPVENGISQSPAYRAATRRGEMEVAPAQGLVLAHPEGLTLTIHPTLAGHVPVLCVAERRDFELLVCALTSRNEPEAVPAAMGACIVSGLNNWDRVAAYRSRWAAGHADAANEDAWAEEFRRLIPQKDLYQDRLILLSSGPYSAVPASQVGLDEGEWLRRSIVLRREHECAHYFTRRALGFMRNNVFDELLADFAGLVGAFGRYEPQLALLFLGLERHPVYRPGGRLESYVGAPPLSDEAQVVLREMTVRAAHSLGQVAGSRGSGNLVDLLPVLATLTLEELASPSSIEQAIAQGAPLDRRGA